jgi:putative sterol carrier protein
MADASTQFFTGLGERGHEPLLEKATGSLRFDLTEDGRRARWLVEIDHGDISVSHRNAKADCVIRAEKAVFDRVAAGRENAVAAVLRGQIEVDGSRHLLVLFQRVFPAPPGKAA